MQQQTSFAHAGIITSGRTLCHTFVNILLGRIPVSGRITDRILMAILINDSALRLTVCLPHHLPRSPYVSAPSPLRPSLPPRIYARAVSSTSSGWLLACQSRDMMHLMHTYTDGRTDRIDEGREGGVLVGCQAARPSGVNLVSAPRAATGCNRASVAAQSNFV